MGIASADERPLPLSEVRSSVQETIARLGFQPNLLLLHDPFVPESGKLVELSVSYMVIKWSERSIFQTLIAGKSWRI